MFSVFFFSLSVGFFWFLWSSKKKGRGPTKTQIHSQILYTLNAYKNGGYKRKNFSEREEMNASSSVVLSSFSFFSVSVSF